jgi:uncharacterized protein YjbJ (UPF0337 family)
VSRITRPSPSIGIGHSINTAKIRHFQHSLLGSDFAYCQQRLLTRSGETMNWDQLQGKWKQVKGRLREKWGQLTDGDLEKIQGRREQFIGVLQERYGLAKEEASKQADEFVKSLNETSEERRAAKGNV